MLLVVDGGCGARVCCRVRLGRDHVQVEVRQGMDWELAESGGGGDLGYFRFFVERGL